MGVAIPPLISISASNMGTNYYVRENECKTCGRHDEIHLGKSSMGWQFIFQYNGGKYYKTIKEMRRWLVGKQIFDENDDEILNKDFWILVKVKQTKSNRKHIDAVNDAYALNIGGYTFIDSEFS